MNEKLDLLESENENVMEAWEAGSEDDIEYTSEDLINRAKEKFDPSDPSEDPSDLEDFEEIVDNIFEQDEVKSYEDIAEEIVEDFKEVNMEIFTSDHGELTIDAPEYNNSVTFDSKYAEYFPDKNLYL